MIDMDYEKKYKDALSRARSMYESQDDAELAAYIFPELCESEDERIRRAIYDFFSLAGKAYELCGIPKANLLAWLEKQKESTWTEEDENFRKHILPRILDPKWWTMEQIEADRKLLKEFVERQKNKWGEKQKEQKPTPTEDMPYITDEHFYEREPADSFKYKLAEYMTKCCTKKEGPYGYTYGISSESILEMAKEELIKRGELQKPAEWSEEDEDVLQNIIQEIEWERRNTTVDKDIRNYDRQLNFLKSLRPQPKQEWDTLDKAIVKCIVCCLDGQFVTEAARKQALEWFNKHRRDFLNSPSWKPSEEQMNALNALNCHGDLSYVGQQNQLISLQKDLEKLM